MSDERDLVARARGWQLLYIPRFPERVMDDLGALAAAVERLQQERDAALERVRFLEGTENADVDLAESENDRLRERVTQLETALGRFAARDCEGLLRRGHVCRRGVIWEMCDVCEARALLAADVPEQEQPPERVHVDGCLMNSLMRNTAECICPDVPEQEQP